MSVVNRMLRDLDKRGYNETGSVKNVNYVAPKSSKGLYSVIACLSVFCIVAGSYSVYLVNKPSAHAPARVSPEMADLQQGDQYAHEANSLKLENKDSQAHTNVVAAHIEFEKNAQQTSRLNDEEMSIASSMDARIGAVISKRNTPSKSEPLIQLAATIPNQATMPIVNFASAVDRESHRSDQKPEKETASVINISTSDGPPTKLSSLRARAHAALQKNDDALLTRLLNEILLIAPLEMQTRKKLASLLFSTNQLSEAQQILSKGIEQSPADSSLRLMLSRLFFKLGDNQNAFAVLSEHPYSSLANDELISFRAALAEKIGQYPLAQQDYQMLVQRNPNNAKWWLGLGVSQDKQQLNTQAVTSYQHAQSLQQLPEQVDSFMATRIQLLSRSS